MAEGAGDLLVAARTLVHGLHQGAHRADTRGASTEFYDYRAASPGDPAHAIDWKVFGRTDRHYIRRFRHETQLTVGIALDASASMEFAGFDADASPSKLRRAKELAAAVAHLVVRQGDRVCLAAGAGERGQVVAPGSGWEHLHVVARALESVTPVGDSGLTGALDACAASMHRRGLVVAIGDGLDDPAALLERLARLRFGAGRSFGAQGGTVGAGHDVVMLQTLTPDELDISRLERARLVDPETGADALGSGEFNAARYRDEMRLHLERIRSGVVGMHGRWALARTDADPREALRRVFDPRGR